MKKKIAFVIQRYGLEVNGGAELHCRQLAERLQPDFDVEVITTCALEYYSWKNHYPKGLQEIHGIKVRYFPVDDERVKPAFDLFSEKVFAEPDNLALGEEWMKLQGPYSSELLRYIKDHQGHYDYFIFFTYLYATTYFGMPLIKDKSKIFLIPTAHDEPTIYLKIFDKIFNSPKGIIYNTEKERAFIYKRFHNQHIKDIIAGVGIELPQEYQDHHAAFKKKHHGRSYLIYIGRIDESKGCQELFNYFLQWKKLSKSAVQLVLIGKEEMTVPKHPDILSLGFLSDQDKFDAIMGSELMMVPSLYESLSMSLLEAFFCQKAVLVNGRCEVLKHHCLLSNGGLWYSNQAEFSESLNYLMDHQNIRTELGKNGHHYVEQHYQWDNITKNIISFLQSA